MVLLRSRVVNPCGLDFICEIAKMDACFSIIYLHRPFLMMFAPANALINRAALFIYFHPVPRVLQTRRNSQIRPAINQRVSVDMVNNQSFF
jgi:hypothetical protein